MRAILAIVLLCAGCTQQKEPENTVEAAPPFELLCKYQEQFGEGRITYRINGKVITTRVAANMDATPTWMDVCHELPDTKVLSCEVNVGDSEITINKSTDFGEATGRDYISIDRITGRYSNQSISSYPTPNTATTLKGECVKSESRAF